MSYSPWTSAGQIKQTPELRAVEAKFNSPASLAPKPFPNHKKPSRLNKWGITAESLTDADVLHMYDLLYSWGCTVVKRQHLVEAFDSIPRRYAAKLRQHGWNVSPKAMRNAFKSMAKRKGVKFPNNGMPIPIK